MPMKKYYWGVLARGYCHPVNSNKQMDPDLIMAMAEELVKADKACAEAEKVMEEMRYDGPGSL